jgi:DNA (cytosine-5)-methyltransferase 1
MHACDLPPPKEKEYWADTHFPFFYMSRNRRRSWDEVSYTIQASGRHTPLHPASPPMKHVEKDKWIFTDDVSKYRRLSVMECARIQTFPDNFYFEGNMHACMHFWKRMTTS